MSQHLIFQTIVDSWENEGGSLRLSSDAESLSPPRFLTEAYIVDGYTYTSLADAVAQAPRLHTSASL